MKNIRTWTWVYLSRSGNKRISYGIKIPNYLTHIWAIHYSRTFFLALSCCYVQYFLESVLSLMKILYCIFFFEKRTFLTQKLLYFFKMVKFNLIFLFLVTYGSFNPVCTREDTAPSQFLILVFDYLIIDDLLVNGLTI